MSSNNLDAWSIPKRKPPPQQDQRRSLNMTIPRRKPSAQSDGGPPNLSGSIPRRQSHGSISHDESSAHHNNNHDGGMKIPRKRSPIPANSQKTREQPIRIGGGFSIISEHPFKVLIPLVGVPLDDGGIPRHRASARTPKRKRPTYQELADTDSDDYLTDSGDDAAVSKSKKKKKFSKSSASSTTSAAASAAVAASSAAVVPIDDGALATDSLGLDNTSLDAPPPGTLNSLWYSRECFLHVFALEKIISWKTRPITQLEWIPETLSEEDPPMMMPAISPADASKWSTMALTNPMVWTDPMRRMEVSRLLPVQCPIVLAMAAQAQKLEEGGPKFRIKPPVDKHREEVYLVKWRGRSHLHASWERGSDLIKYDQSNNTARHKIRRFVQSQETAYGLKWKEVLEEERATTATIHAHGEQAAAVESDNVEDEFFPPGCTEVERILACDESEMDLGLFAKQRALNTIREQELVQRRDNGTIIRWRSEEGLNELLKEAPWDPEDNVRYVVKWKGLPFAEMTWEYWRDIKRDCVDEAEDFWIRQQPPDQETIDRCIKFTHPHMRDFRKIQESPVFGVSSRGRPVADLGQPKETTEDDDEPTNAGLRLRSYQLEGVNWLLFNWWNKRSCILADEMGLGKTIQSMCFIKTLQDLPTTGVRGPYLIVAPLSLIGQWQAEAKTWAPDLNVVLYHGSADARDFLVKQDFFYTDQFVPKATATKLKKNHITKFHILITTYEVVLKDVNVISKIRWKTLIVDEAHRLKNPKSRLFEELATVPRDYCVLLTGTPLANATEELWALLHFADDVAFGDKDEFLEKFGQLTDADQVEQLHTVLKPYLLRRVKEDVEKTLPPKEETILEVSLTPIQKQFYKAIYERNTSFLFKGSKPSNAPSLMNVMMELRKCCNHPYLVRGAEERILADAANHLKDAKDADGNPIPLNYTELFGEQLIKSSGKMVLINKLLPKLYANGHKVLIFSQMVRVLDLLEELIKMMKYKYERLDGSTSSSSRAAAVDRFVRKSCQRFVMLLSTRAGGLGLNLTAADIVIIFDSDWNPQNDLQAMARAHRIGQTRAVRVYRLLTAKTYEMHMFHSASMKLGLEKAVLSHQRDHGEDGNEGKSKTKSEREAQAKEIDSLLKKGAYDVFRDEDDEEAQKFMETDIDQLLERNASTVTYGPNQTNMSSGLGSFSKASFVTDTGDGEKDVDLDDPDFWQKAVGLDAPVETPEEVAQMIDDGVKRSRKQVQVFDPYAEFAEAEQRRQDKIAQNVKKEKEEKEKARAEKKKRKKDEKERKEKEREELRGSLFGKSTAPQVEVEEEESSKVKKQSKEPKAKKPKKSADKKRAQRRAQNEDPVLERLKQAWDVPQRSRAIAACLRYGFMRFCKIRNESNLTSLPIQDLEVFFRSYFFQLSLQVVVSFLQMLKEHDKVNDGNIKALLSECLGLTCEKEINWLCNCFSSGMKHYLEVEKQRRDLRMPFTLADQAFMTDLRRGHALRSLRRIFMLCRVQRIVEDSLDEVLSELGHEELGKRGCQTSHIAAMDVDLKSRLVTAEELSLSISAHLEKVELRAPVAWWDRSCDIFLLIGTFVHGLGNYEAMLHDDTLPYAFRIRKYSKRDAACVAAQERFILATHAAKKIFDNALEATKLKAQEEVQAAVAAAAADASAREKNALALREGGAAADAVLSSLPEDEKSSGKVTVTDEQDARFVSLQKIKAALCESASSNDTLQTYDAITSAPPTTTSREDINNSEDLANRRKHSFDLVLSMPDARILDQRLGVLLSQIEANAYPGEASEVEMWRRVSPDRSAWPSTKIVTKNCDMRTRALSYVYPVSDESIEEAICEFAGIGVNGAQCGASHRSLDDGSDFSVGAASADLAHVAYGTDAPRYLRAIGVPMNLTRYALLALMHADNSTVDQMLCAERTVERSKPVGEGGEQKKKSPEVEPKKRYKIPRAFEKNSNLRAGTCAVILHYGFPFNSKEGTKVYESLWNSVHVQCGHIDESEPDRLFSEDRFIELIKSVTGKSELPEFSIIKEYVFGCLLPHCLRLCVMGNGPTTVNARGSKVCNDEYETSHGSSLYPEHSQNVQVALPDPCLGLGDHSIEALAAASAIVRRMRLMKTAISIASGKLSLNQLNEVLHSSFLRKSMEGLPVWWCPWIHDAALLVHASSRGLFAILKDRNSEADSPLAFSLETIKSQMYSTFVADESAISRSIVDESPPEDAQAWIEEHANVFPTANVLERRLSFLCAKASEALGSEDQYYNLPMFDHGAWPRN